LSTRDLGAHQDVPAAQGGCSIADEIRVGSKTAASDDASAAGAAEETVARRLTGVSGRILGLSLLIAGVAGALYLLAVRHVTMSGAPIAIPLLILAVGYAVSELTVVHIEFQRDAHSVSLNEIPLVLALVFTTPGHLLVAHLVGAGAVLVLHRRQAVLKLVFNLSHFALEDCVAIVVFHSLAGGAVRLGPSLWIAAVVATIAAATVSVVTVSVVIWVHQNRVMVSQLRAVVSVALVGALFNACVGLVAVTVLWVDVRGAVLLVAIGAIVCVAYGAYASLRQRHASLELLYQFTQAVRGSGNAEQIVTDVLAQARQMVRAEIAELAILPSGDNHGIDWLILDSDSDVPTRTVEPSLHPSLAALVESRHPVVGAKTERDPRIRAHLAQRGYRDCIVAPLVVDAQVIGILTVANRLGDVSTFDEQDGRLFETIAAHTSVTLQNARLVDRLRHEALHDNLTDLPNRVLFQQRLADLLARQRPTDPHIAVMLIDLDRFKEINDTLGHATGDLLLQEVAGRLRRAVADRVTVARLGGDEFALLDPAQSGPEEAVALAKTLREELHRPFAYEDLELEVSATIGVAVAPGNGRDASTLLRRADVAMYAAKNTAAGVAAYGENLDEHSPRKLALVGELRTVIDDDGLELHYQPKVEMATGRVIGVEALVRWPHPVEGLVPPDEFVPIAERTGLIGPMTDFVLRTALAQCRRWDEAGHDLSVAVNLSARSLLDADLVDDIARALSVSGVDASKLVLEITETSVMSDAEYAMHVLNRLSAMGLTLAIDDFGTGYSSLSYLKRLPVDEVKIDKSFVLNMQQDDNDAVIVRSIIDLARNLGLRVVAEGVETESTWDALHDMGCDIAQGYVISRPLPADQLSAWLETVTPTPLEFAR
jgi:diguanylate cyclase (GGDEF)-like protein